MKIGMFAGVAVFVVAVSGCGKPDWDHRPIPRLSKAVLYSDSEPFAYVQFEGVVTPISGHPMTTNVPIGTEVQVIGDENWQEDGKDNVVRDVMVVIKAGEYADKVGEVSVGSLRPD